MSATTDELRADAAYCLDVLRREWTGSEKHSRLARVLPPILEGVLADRPADDDRFLDYAALQALGLARCGTEYLDVAFATGWSERIDAGGDVSRRRLVVLPNSTVLPAGCVMKPMAMTLPRRTAVP